MISRDTPLDWALFYLSRGLSPVPARKDIKAPSIQDWTKYARVKPSKEDIEEWFKGKTWSDVNIFLVMGNGVFGIDFDKPELWYLFFSKTPEELAKNTWVEKTPKGYHVYFRAPGEIKTIEAPGLVELKGDGRGFLVAPSIRSDGGRYKFISNIEEVKISHLDEFQIQEAGELIKKIKKLYPVIREVLPIWKEGIRHDVAVLLSGAMHSKGITLEDGEFIIRAICKLARDEELEDRIRALKDTYADATPSGVPKFKGKIGKEFGEDVAERILQKLTELSPHKSQIEKNTEEKKEEERIKKVPYIDLEDDLYLAVWDGKENYKFAHLSRNGEIELLDKVEIDGITYIPKEKGNLPVSYPTFGIIEVPDIDTHELFEVLKSFIWQYVDMKNDDLEMSIFYILSTWFYRKSNTTAYLRFLGDTGKGKSRMLKVIGDLCFYPVKVGGNATRSAIMRVQEMFHGTLIIDESDFKGDKENELTKYINSGFERDNPIIITNKNTYQLETYDPFSPKLFAMRHPFGDSATEGRVLSIEPYETLRDDIPAVLPLEYDKEVLQLRDIIARWTLENWNKVKMENLELIQNLPIEPRLKQLATPLAIILPLFEGSMKNKFTEWLLRRQKEIIENRKNSPEGLVFNAIVDLANGETEDLTEKFKDYLYNPHLDGEDYNYTEEDEGKPLVITTGMIAEITGLNSSRVRKILLELGFEVVRKKLKIKDKKKTPHMIILENAQRWAEAWRRYRDFSNIGDIPLILRDERKDYDLQTGARGVKGASTIHTDINEPQYKINLDNYPRSDNIGAYSGVRNTTGTTGTTDTNPHPSKDKTWQINPDGKGEDLLLVDNTPPSLLEIFSSKLLKLKNGKVVILPMKTAIMYEGMEFAEPLAPTLLDYFFKPWSKLVYGEDLGKLTACG